MPPIVHVFLHVADFDVFNLPISFLSCSVTLNCPCRADLAFICALHNMHARLNRGSESMSLVGTLGKVALGIAVARGVGKVMGGQGAGGLGGLLGGASGQSGGLGGLLGGLKNAAGGAQQGGSAGGLGGLLGGSASGGSAGGLAGLLGGGASGGAAGGLGGLLGGAQSGGLGGLLESLGGAGGGAAAGGLGGLLNGALSGEQPAQAPTQAQEETAKILIRAMVNAAKSDGQIDETEQQKIVSNLGEEVSEEERNFVLSEMQSPLDLAGFINEVPRGAEQQVYLMSLMAIDLDSQAEAQYLDKLREGFGMTQEASNAIHAQVGVPPLYG